MGAFLLPHNCPVIVTFITSVKSYPSLTYPWGHYLRVSTPVVYTRWVPEFLYRGTIEAMDTEYNHV